MNTSGRAVASILRARRASLGRLVILHDDKDLAFGNFKFQKGRNSAGHKGVQSIMDALGSKDFWRLRIGIGSPPEDVPTDAYVLQQFPQAERERLTREVFPRAIETVERHVGTEKSKS